MMTAETTVTTLSAGERNRLRRSQSPTSCAGSAFGSGGGTGLAAVRMASVTGQRSTIARRRLARLTNSEMTSEMTR